MSSFLKTGALPHHSQLSSTSRISAPTSQQRKLLKSYFKGHRVYHIKCLVSHTLHVINRSHYLAPAFHRMFERITEIAMVCQLMILINSKSSNLIITFYDIIKYIFFNKTKAYITISTYKYYDVDSECLFKNIYDKLMEVQDNCDECLNTLFSLRIYINNLDNIVNKFKTTSISWKVSANEM